MTTSTSPTSSSSAAGAFAVGPALARLLARADGTTRTPPPGAAWFKGVHGRTVVTADGPGCVGEADALVTTRRGLPLLTRAGDCGMLAFAAPEGVVGVAHAGWRGLVAGIIPAAAQRMRDLGATTIVGYSGPALGSCCCEFGEDDLRLVCDAVGADVRGTTADGTIALDAQAAIAAACARAEVELVAVDRRCTACDADGTTFYSHRARRDRERHGVLAWLP